MVKRSALQLYYKLLETTASLKPLFFSISLSIMILISFFLFFFFFWLFLFYVL